mmetsp:Transcript_11057/g.19161  ORF Transcript_11057/g.19161 Transcript_11057/m.19161 type:complete len:204 (-) Transcript_11057:142-753(-)
MPHVPHQAGRHQDPCCLGLVHRLLLCRSWVVTATKPPWVQPSRGWSGLHARRRRLRLPTAAPAGLLLPCFDAASELLLPPVCGRVGPAVPACLDYARDPDRWACAHRCACQEKLEESWGCGEVTVHPSLGRWGARGRACGWGTQARHVQMCSPPVLGSPDSSAAQARWCPNRPRPAAHHRHLPRSCWPTLHSCELLKSAPRCT